MSTATYKAYYQLTKPGIIYGNALPTIAGFFLASKNHIDLWLLIAALLGQSLIIASGCVFNNYIDRGIDKKMTRTKKRALVTGEISGQSALWYGAILGIFGVVVLALWTNILTVLVGLLGLFVYVVLYGITKRRGPYGTLIGSIAGALPPVAGYTAVTGSVDGGAVILFLILAFWQMPHFYAIAMYRREDYADAGLPVLSVKRGMTQTKYHIIAYTLGFLVVALMLTIFDYTGYTYGIIALLLGGIWLCFGLQGFRKGVDDVAWARKMFFFSLIVLTVLSATIALNNLLP